MHTICRSKLDKSGVQRFKRCTIGVETKKLWPFEDNRIKLCENFATAKWECGAVKWRSCAKRAFLNFVQLSSNSHNFFVSALICTPFKELDL